MPYSVMHDLLFTDYEAVSRRFYGQDIGVDINSVASLLSTEHHMQCCFFSFWTLAQVDFLG